MTPSIATVSGLSSKGSGVRRKNEDEPTSEIGCNKTTIVNNM